MKNKTLLAGLMAAGLYDWTAEDLVERAEAICVAAGDDPDADVFDMHLKTDAQGEDKVVCVWDYDPLTGKVTRTLKNEGAVFETRQTQGPKFPDMFKDVHLGASSDHYERQRLETELTWIDRIIAETPEDAYIDRMSMEARRDVVMQSLDNLRGPSTQGDA